MSAADSQRTGHNLPVLSFIRPTVLTLPAWYAEQGLCNGRASVCPSVCLSRGPIAAGRAAGLLLSALRAGYIDRQLRAPCSRRRRSAEAARQHGAQQQVQAASR